MRARGKSYYEHACLQITKPGDRFAPVFMIFVCLAFNNRNFLAPFHKARTFTALNDFLVK
jgi:hypothetical protein